MNDESRAKLKAVLELATDQDLQWVLSALLGELEKRSLVFLAAPLVWCECQAAAWEGFANDADVAVLLNALRILRAELATRPAKLPEASA